ncbi:unnamed protein product [Rotaria magnacalcarata]|uniref:Uncharacterized protein n=1 Tax=Rotaria magnacalcarata TaxID=392030 RepID=A0A8S2YJF1_9BILA|nr:unnamed protein product [Rotaria magnacalcarata]
MVAKGTQDRRSSSSTKAATTSTTTKRTRISSASHDKKKVAKPIGICGFCLGDNEKNANGVSEKMINCAECGNSGIIYFEFREHIPIANNDFSRTSIMFTIFRKISKKNPNNSLAMYRLQTMYWM